MIDYIYFYNRILCLITGHNWRIWWQRSNSAYHIIKRSCNKCGKIEKNYDFIG